MGRILASYTGQGMTPELRRDLLGSDETDEIMESWAAGVVLFIRETGPKTTQVIALDISRWAWARRFRQKP